MNLLREPDSKASCSGKAFNKCGRMPDFLMIGAMKSGTTTLFQLLERHPRIFVPYWKEPQYFSRDHKFNLGEKWYTDNFAGGREDQIIGEASTCYSRWPHYPHAAERIANRLPNIRIIYLMRHPIERAYSHYGHIMQERLIRNEEKILTFEEALEEEKEIIDASLYMMQIERYLPLFSREQFLFLTFDELKSSPDALLQRTQKFLGVELIDLISQGGVNANRWGDKVSKTRTRGFIEKIQWLSGISGIKNIISKGKRQRLKDTLIHSKLLNSLFKSGLKDLRKSLSPLTPETRERLLKQFEGPTSSLERFLGWKLPTWHR